MAKNFMRFSGQEMTAGNAESEMNGVTGMGRFHRNQYIL